MKKLTLTILAFLSIILTNSYSAQAGLNDMTYFVEPSKFSVGTEVDISFKKEYGSFLNLKGKQGITDLLNIEETAGIGTNDRRYRLGAKAILDVFPDFENQPGFGIGLGTDFFKLDKGSLTELCAIPYVHKKFKAYNVNSNVFLAYNFNVQLDTNSSSYSLPMTIATGLNFFPTPKEDFMITGEINIPLTSSAYTTISGGIGYRF